MTKDIDEYTENRLREEGWSVALEFSAPHPHMGHTYVLKKDRSEVRIYAKECRAFLLGFREGVYQQTLKEQKNETR
jgi:hypothetical protein